MSNHEKGETIESIGNVVFIRTDSIRFNKTWVIEKHHENSNHVSPIFSIGPNHRLKWRLTLHRKLDTISTYLTLLPCNISKMTAKLTYSLLNADGQKVQTLPTQKYRKSISATEITEYRRAEWFFSKLNFNAGKFPGNGMLVLFCDIELIVDNFDVLDNSLAIEVPICDIVDNIGQFLETKELRDVTINVCGHEFSAHKSILAMRSPVFLAMFVHEMVEKQTNHVNVTDMEPEVFREMLRFVYTGEAPNIDKMAEELLVAAEKYELKRLKVMCEEALRVQIAVDNAADMLILADVNNANHLKKRTIDFIIGSNLRNILETEGCQMLIESHPALMAELLRSLAEANELQCYIVQRSHP